MYLKTKGGKMRSFIMTCEVCGSEFTCRQHNAKYCPGCKEDAYNEKQVQWRKRARAKRKSVKVKQEFKSINEVLADIEAYNKKHGSNLSYGQYIAMRREIR